MKTILITGCSSGIGFDAAKRMKTAGWQVIATCRNPADCDELKSLGCESYALDYSDSASVQSGAQRALEIGNGSVDALFNNGAFATPGLVEDLPRGALQEIFEGNVFGQFELINALLPAMRAAGGGHIVNCSSVLGFSAPRFRGAYCATKYAMEGLTDALRIELNGSGIHVVLIEPGPITSRIRQNSIPHFERWIDVENSAQKSLYDELLIPRLYKKNDAGEDKKDRFELPASAVSDKLVKIVESDRPRPRYYVTVPTYIAGTLKRLLSSRAFDRLLLSR